MKFSSSRGPVVAAAAGKLVFGMFLCLLIAGCLGGGTDKTDHPAESPSTTGSSNSVTSSNGALPSAQSWAIGQVLEKVDCQAKIISVYAERERLPILPAGFTTPGTGPVPVLVLVDQCQSASIENSSLEAPAEFVLAIFEVEVETPLEGPERQDFIIESSSSWAVPATLTGRNSVPGGVVEVTVDSQVQTSIHVAGLNIEYQIDGAQSNLPAGNAMGLTTRLWGGAAASFSAILDRSVQEGDRLPTACVAEFSAGPLASVFPDPTPCTMSAQRLSDSLTLEISL